MCPPPWTTPPPRGYPSAWLWCKTSWGSSHWALGSSGGPSPSGHLGLAGHLCGRSEQLGPPRSPPTGRKRLSHTATPSLPPATVRDPPRSRAPASSAKAAPFGAASRFPGPRSVWGGPGPHRAAFLTLGQPSSPSLPSGGWLPPAGRLRGGGGPRCTSSSLPRRHVHQRAPAWHPPARSRPRPLLHWPYGCRPGLAVVPAVPGAAGQWGGARPCPLPGSPLCPGLGRGQGLGAANNSSPRGRYFSGRSCPDLPARLPGGPRGRHPPPHIHPAVLAPLGARQNASFHPKPAPGP